MNFDCRQVPKPVHRGNIRKYFGKVYFCTKRKLKWYLGSETYASINKNKDLSFSIVAHRSFLLRPLKNVEMYLQHNKIKNLQLAIEKLNGVIIRPGETFSFWKLVGKTKKKRGYLEGLTLENGKISSGTGGGLCQLGNLLYWMTLHSPLTVHERWRHGYDVFPDINRTIPFACGATLSYNYVDLQIKNNTRSIFQLKLWLDDAYLQGEIVSNTAAECTYEISESDHLMKLQWWGGYTRHNKIWKTTFNKLTNERKTELISENHAIMMYNPLLE
jgi:vancomycin resistance protein VanW